MRVAIWKIGNWKPSIQYGDRSGGENLRVACKILTEGELKDKTIYLNLDTADMKTVNRWLPVVVEGNVLSVNIREIYNQNTKKKTRFIDKYGQYSIIKKAEGKEALTVEGELPGQLVLL